MGIIIKPIVTEKMTVQVSVASVNTLNYHGKKKSRFTKAGVLRGRMNHYKKAYVTLAGDDKIDFYANI